MEEDQKTRIAVVLFNLGAPDNQAAVRPFLRNLFKDPAIISLPGFLRLPLAAFISWRRGKTAQDIYAAIGGGSPLLANTERQAVALETALNQKDDAQFKCFIAMRYWHPFSSQAIDRIKVYGPSKLVLLPLYPQYAAATTGSSFRDWQEVARRKNLAVVQRAICCWPENQGFIAAIAAEIAGALKNFPSPYGSPRLLFSAHGLPQRAADKGDPYPLHVMRTAGAVMQKLDRPDIEWRVAYQSRVGPLEWLRPYMEDEIKIAGREKKSLIVIPIAFVSEHSETLVELDRDYRALASAQGVPHYVRTPTVGTTPLFIEGLADMVRHSLARGKPGLAPDGETLCPQDCQQCPSHT